MGNKCDVLYIHATKHPTGDFTLTGYTDNGQVPAEEKMQMYHTLFD